MSEFAKPIDVRTSAILQELARQVQQSRQAIPLMQDDQIVAILQPATTQATSDLRASYDPRRTREALRASAGALKGVDTAELLADIHAQRGCPFSRSPWPSPRGAPGFGKR